jgi:hypothetical protein
VAHRSINLADTDRCFGQKPIVPNEHLTEDQKVSMLTQPAAERRFLLERMPAAIARAVEEGRPARAEALKAEYEFMMEVESGVCRGINE